jgi:hypothetical protein
MLETFSQLAGRFQDMLETFSQLAGRFQDMLETFSTVAGRFRVFPKPSYRITKVT